MLSSGIIILTPCPWPEILFRTVGIPPSKRLLNPVMCVCKYFGISSLSKHAFISFEAGSFELNAQFLLVCYGFLVLPIFKM